MPTPIDVTVLVELVDAGACELVDALGATWYDDVHLPGAINLPPAAVRRLAPLRLPDRARTVVVYCSRATRESEHVAGTLEQLGHLDVRVLSGGREAWVEAGLPVERAEPC
jgi:rhodanese-related sulfurtransferase